MRIEESESFINTNKEVFGARVYSRSPLVDEIMSRAVSVLLNDDCSVRMRVVYGLCGLLIPPSEGCVY
jgi:hypothetical protein